ncbi:MAG: DUF2284 domain-containing protein [Clostridiales bacterium]|jgi:predicted metal-binding protein|nr:DUF2284 domain-containing protein [Clostridiales bacterium]
MNTDEVIRRALDQGFSFSVPLDPATIKLRPEVRDMCASNRCHSYNKNWTCPPAIGTLDECSERISRYSRGILVQTMGYLEDEFDIEGMEEISISHRHNFASFHDILIKDFPNALSLGAGGCTRCEKCTYPDLPCRFPHLALSSMEGYGMIVSEVCKMNGLPYNYGVGTLVFVGCYLLD